MLNVPFVTGIVVGLMIFAEVSSAEPYWRLMAKLYLNPMLALVKGWARVTVRDAPGCSRVTEVFSVKVWFELEALPAMTTWT